MQFDILATDELDEHGPAKLLEKLSSQIVWGGIIIAGSDVTRVEEVPPALVAEIQPALLSKTKNPL